ncbi:uncharacterized protein LOC144351788 [Saccoglossus kowalevskii]
MDRCTGNARSSPPVLSPQFLRRTCNHCTQNLQDWNPHAKCYRCITCVRGSGACLENICNHWGSEAWDSFQQFVKIAETDRIAREKNARITHTAKKDSKKTVQISKKTVTTKCTDGGDKSDKFKTKSDDTAAYLHELSEALKSIETHEERLMQRVRSEGLFVRNSVIGDGNCFFRVVQDQLERFPFHPILNHAGIRKKVVNYLKGHPTTYEGINRKDHVIGS